MRAAVRGLERSVHARKAVAHHNNVRLLGVDDGVLLAGIHALRGQQRRLHGALDRLGGNRRAGNVVHIRGLRGENRSGKLRKRRIGNARRLLMRGDLDGRQRAVFDGHLDGELSAHAHGRTGEYAVLQRRLCAGSGAAKQQRQCEQHGKNSVHLHVSFLLLHSQETLCLHYTGAEL